MQYDGVPLKLKSYAVVWKKTAFWFACLSGLNISGESEPTVHQLIFWRIWPMVSLPQPDIDNFSHSSGLYYLSTSDLALHRFMLR